MTTKGKPRTKATDSPGVDPDDVMSEAGRKILAFHFARMLKEEPGVRKGEDIEAVHDMRVATRRMRSTLNLFRPFYDDTAIKPLRRRLRKIARALGAVRDLDVFRLKAEAYADTLAQNGRADFQPLLDDWRLQEEAARQPLLDLLDSDRYAEFVADFTQFVNTPGAGASQEAPLNREGDPAPIQVRTVAPQMIYEQYGIVRAYAPHLEGASLNMLHNLRIEIKRLRYMLEAFAEVLGAEVKPVIEATKAMQDHLGDLQDARVAVGLLKTYLKGRANGSKAITPEVQAVRSYRDACKAAQQQLRVGVPEAWAKFASPALRRKLALAVSVL